MRKALVAFKSDEESTSLEISSYGLSPSEHILCMKELAGAVLREGIRFTFIDADSLQAVISSDDYFAVWDIYLKLTDLGWSFTDDDADICVNSQKAI